MMTKELNKNEVFKKHNEEVKQLMKEFNAGNPSRIPVLLYPDERFYILTPEINRLGVTWKELCDNTDAVIAHRIQIEKWIRNLEEPYCDQEFPGPGQFDSWGPCTPFFESAHEAAVFGARIEFPSNGDNPDVRPILSGEFKNRLFDMSLPDIEPEGDNIVGRTINQVKEIAQKCAKMKVDGKPIALPRLPNRLFSGDGPFTIGIQLRGSELLLDIYEDPSYVHHLMDFITKGIIHRVKIMREYVKSFKGKAFFNTDIDLEGEHFGFSDDSAEMLSEETYKGFVLPYNKRLVEEISKPGTKIFVHMCGKAQHLFKVMRDELRIHTFDTGFPTDLGKARRELGTEVILLGNITPEHIRSGPVALIGKEILSAIRSGVTEGKKFMLKDGTNIPPLTPMEHLLAFYAIGKRVGRYV